jgi:hypothetical protein
MWRSDAEARALDRELDEPDSHHFTTNVAEAPGFTVDPEGSTENTGQLLLASAPAALPGRFCCSASDERSVGLFTHERVSCLLPLFSIVTARS